MGCCLDCCIDVYMFVVVYSKEEDDCSAGQREPSLPSERAYRYHAITLGVLTVAFITTTLVTVREQKGGQWLFCIRGNTLLGSCFQM